MTTDELRTAGAEAGLRRARDRKMIAGVCEGAGRFFGMDPVVFRVALSVLALSGGLGLVVYGIAWLLVPTEGDGPRESEAHRLLSGRVEGPALTALLFALVGCGLFLSIMGSTSNLTFSLTLLGALAGAVFWSRQRARSAPDTSAEASAVAAATAAPPAAGPPPAPVPMAWWKEPQPPVYLWGPDDGPYDHAKASLHARLRERAERHRRRREGAQIGGLVFTLALLAGGAATAARWHDQPLGTSLETGLAAALAVFGIGFLITTRYGRLGGGTATLAVLTAATLVGAAAMPKSIGTDWHKVTWRPASATALEEGYVQGAGDSALDLSALRPERGQNLRTAVDLSLGRLTLTVPRSATVHIAYHVELGDVRLPGDSKKDVDVRTDQSGTASYTRTGPAGAGSQEESGTIDVDVHVGAGQLVVVRK